MARLASPPAFSRLASGTAKPAARRAPIQSAASRTTLSISAATRTTTLRVASVAAQVSRSARVLTAASRTNEGACLRALREVIVVCKNMTSGEQMTVKTQIPRPKTTTTHAAIMKWAKSRQYKTLVWKTAVKDKKKIRGLAGVADEKSIAKVEECQKVEMEWEEDAAGDTVIETNNNPELLNDVSFDANLDPEKQSSTKSQSDRLDELFGAHYAGGRVAMCQVYGGGNSFLGRKRPKVVKIDPKSKIPRLKGSTLKYGVIKYDTTTFTSAEQNATKTYNCFGFGIKSHAHLQAEPNSLTALDVALFQPEPVNVVRPERVVAHKAVSFDTHPVKPRLFDREAAPRAAKTSLSTNRGWAPLRTDYAYPGSSVARGFKTMFQSTSLQTIALKRRVLQRYKAVQEYEKRRKQEAIAAASYEPPLGQLDYGNTDYKLGLQLNSRITVDDIGMWVDSCELGIPASTYDPLNGPLLHFGGFEDEHGRIFENAYIPEMAAGYKEAISWDDAPSSAEALHEWTFANFATMQPAGFEDLERD